MELVNRNRELESLVSASSGASSLPFTRREVAVVAQEETEEAEGGGSGEGGSDVAPAKGEELEAGGQGEVVVQADAREAATTD